ncbi:MAG: MotA/TolQ/ExbB proton channel family protein [Gammaproteobacteria bacterium]|nr:MotA/TolQ/ExbB proton channel family protein [Gammaproteobacteria bacterium]
MIPAWLTEHYSNVETLLFTGGDVLLILFGVAFLLWWFIIERVWFFFGPSRHHRDAKRLSDKLELVLAWEARWNMHKALWLRKRWVSESHIRASHGMMAIKGLVQICPLLGLLGTITGMVEVFSTMSITGNNSARLLSDGISRATYPTFAGLVIALSGYYFITLFEHRARRESAALREHLLLPAHMRK